ncbi:MAG: hypothetical protein J6J44_10870 [Lachnospiraceae bacterium]|nr:hypothetical protein [Lachnospiraceae bacterium]
MEPYLLYRDSSTDGKKSYAFPRDVMKDLNLDIIFKTMAKQDDLIHEKVRRVMMLPLTTPEEVYYRQEVLRDLRRQDAMLEDFYAIAVRQNKALKDLKAAIKSNRAKSTRKTSELFECLNYLMQGQDDLIKIRELLLQKKDAWQSEGVQNLLERLKEMPLESIKKRLREANSLTIGCEAGYTFQFGGGMKMEKAELNFIRPNGDAKKNGLENFYLTFLKRNAILIGTDVTLQEDVNHLAEETLGQIITIFQPYLQKMMVFYEHYCEEISFYMGAVQFMRRMDELYVTLKLPEPKPVGSKDTSFEQLYELSMAVYTQRKPVGNSITLLNNRMTIITGANQGGKSTFLRSYGIAQVLMQCGMPVPAGKFSAPLYPQIFTHFTRNEDEHLNNGRLSEELQRMSNMINKAVPNSLFLLNESFASTTEKEGSKIAEGIINAFYEKNITTMMVTHLYQLAKKKYDEAKDGSHFLVAERTENGTRTFKMLPGEPTYTSFGTDLFKVLEG